MGANRIVGNVATLACLKPSSGGHQISGTLHVFTEQKCQPATNWQRETQCYQRTLPIDASHLILHDDGGPRPISSPGRVTQTKHELVTTGRDKS